MTVHELSVALSILDVAAEAAQRQGPGRVVAIHLKLGLLAGVVTEALRSAFDLARETVPFKEVELVIDEVPVAVWCPACAAERPVISIQEMGCAVCGALSAQVVRGRELEVVALEIES
jgi:hydrogenase nickel incorporation protein HypA/HybF